MKYEYIENSLFRTTKWNIIDKFVLITFISFKVVLKRKMQDSKQIRYKNKWLMLTEKL